MSVVTETSTPERILQRIEWKIIRRLDGRLQGDYRSLFYGYGIDFSDLREYQPYDDVRYIDWNVTARMDAPYVRQYTEDRDIAAWFLLDLSPSLDFGTGLNVKRAKLIDFVATMARLLTRHGNRVGAMLYANRLERIVPARSGRIQVLNLIKDLLAQPIFPPAGMTNLAPLLEAAVHTIRRRSLIFVVSDFISQPGWDRTLGLLNRRHEVLAIQLWDPGEAEIPDIGPVIMQDSESGEQLYVDTHDKRFRERFQRISQRREEQLKGVFQHAGIEQLPLSTSDDLVSAIIRFSAIRRQRRR